MSALLKKISGFILLASFALAGIAQPAFAKLEPITGQQAGDLGIVKQGDLKENIIIVLQWLLGFLGVVTVIMIIYGGVLYITSAGDEDKAETGKRVIIYAIIGLLLVGFAAVIVNTVLTNIIGAGAGAAPK